MATKPINVATYHGVSREDQEPENQRLQLREFCERW
jgi:DNA invertase Pin-like site-specific DNA recombinase